MQSTKPKPTEASGTHLQGFIRTTYAHIREHLGEPHIVYGDKTTAEWACELDGVTFTIYDWKEPATPTYEYDWHVGGYDGKALVAAASALQFSFPTISQRR